MILAPTTRLHLLSFKDVIEGFTTITSDPYLFPLSVCPRVHNNFIVLPARSCKRHNICMYGEETGEYFELRPVKGFTHALYPPNNFANMGIDPFKRVHVQSSITEVLWHFKYQDSKRYCIRSGYFRPHKPCTKPRWPTLVYAQRLVDPIVWMLGCASWRS